MHLVTFRDMVKECMYHLFSKKSSDLKTVLNLNEKKLLIWIGTNIGVQLQGMIALHGL